MSLLIATFVGLLIIVLERSRDGWLWRMLVETPARKLSQMTWRQILITAIVLLMALGASELVLMDLAWVLAADIVAWIELFAAVLVVTRVLPGWRAFTAWIGRCSNTAPRARPRAVRSRRLRRPGKVSDDPDPEWGAVFA